MVGTAEEKAGIGWGRERRLCEEGRWEDRRSGRWWRRKREGWSLLIVTVEDEVGGRCGMLGGRRR